MKLYLLSFLREPSDILNQVKYLQDCWNRNNNSEIKFIKAEINLDLDRLTLDPHNDGFYPLRLYALTPYNDELIVMCSEFKIGSHEPPCLKLVECLEYLGFKLSPSDIATIYSDRKVNLTLWNEQLLVETDL